jgi:predicted component of type VI protein secretion system
MSPTITFSIEKAVPTKPSPPPSKSSTTKSSPPPSSGGVLGGGILTWVIVGVVIAVIVAASIAVVVARSRRSSGGKSTTVTAPPPPPPPQFTPSPQFQPQATPSPPPSQKTSTEETKLGTVLYRLVLPNGTEIPVTEPVKVFGRETFERWGLPKEVLGFISREEKGGHFKIFMRGGKWYIEDCGSKNGTLLNGVEIKGKGPQELKDGDVISPGGVVNIVFKLA